MAELIELLRKLLDDPLAKLAYLIVTAFSMIANFRQAQIVSNLREDLHTREKELNKLRDDLDRREAELNKLNESLEQREVELNSLKKAIEDSEGNIWNIHKSNPPPDHQRRITEQKPIILTIANLKGGVGKSTLTANLGRYFHSRGNNVLLIDFDYQGSLSNTLLNIYGQNLQRECHNSSNILKCNLNDNVILSNALPISQNIPRLDFIPTFYDLAKDENRLLLSWLLRKTNDDVRYRLSNHLLKDNIRERYDVILIDTPPRLTTGTVNALCSSNHFLVPTVLDNTSAEAVRSFLVMVINNIKPLNPALNLLGIVGTATLRKNQLMEWEENSVERILSEMIWLPRKPFFKRHIPRKASISRAAGTNFAFDTDKMVKRWFEDLGGEIEEQIYGTRPEPLHAATAAK